MTIPWPLMAHQLCFNADPNQVGAVPVWVDYTALVRKIGQNRRGRNYELAQSVAASPDITWRDPSEILNPVNTSSPQYPFVQPYRKVLSQVMWPNPANGLGADVNLINTGRWMPNDDLAPDPSFESFANGATVPWLTAVGATAPLVTTTNPQQGTKSVTWTTVATTTVQGARWTVDTIPGVAYVSSVYVRQSAACTQRLSIIDQTLAWDEFQRTSASTWTTSSSGAAWTANGGVSADYTVASGIGTISVTATAADRTVALPVGSADATVQCLFTATTTPVGAGTQQGIMARHTDSSNYYAARIAIDTTGVVTAIASKRVTAVTTTLASAVTTVRTGEGIMCKLYVSGPLIKVKVWNESGSEPSAWTVETSDTALSTGSNAGVLARRETSETAPLTFGFAHFYAVGSVSSSTTATTGAYVRLSTTWTATQPLHTVELSTVGTAVVATVNLDALQHELGAAASTFTTAGPVIYPLLNNFAERFPREYEAAGFVGKTATPAVDGFAALNAISIYTDYVQAVLASRPAYYWPLSGGASTVRALEVSGNNGSPLVLFNSKYGAGNAPVFGTQIAIAGDAGATGVRFTPVTAGSVSFDAATILSLGRVPTSPGIVFPRDYTTAAWGASISAWVKINIPTADTTMTIAGPFAATKPVSVSPVAIVCTAFAAPFSVVDFAVTTQNSAVGASATATAADQSDGAHLIVGTVTQTAGGNTVVSIYVDGVLVDDTTVTTASLGGIYATPATFFNTGGNTDGGLVVDGTVAHVSLWERALTASEITALWTAGGLGNASETTGARLERHLSNGNYAGTRRISDTCSTTLEAPTWSGSIDLLTDAQSLALAEQGTVWMAPDGALVLESRKDRWLRLTSLATFGEDTASGEIPYLDGITFDYDPTFVYANVAITRNGGSVAIGGTAAQIATVKRKFFGRPYAIGADFETDTQAQDYADWTFATHKAPLLRVSTLIVDISANSALWASVLKLEIGKRVTVKRRAKAANSGAGITMSADYFIEAVAHSEIDMDKRRWLVGFLLSPIGVLPDPTFQPWILENATYGVLDSTTILGF